MFGCRTLDKRYFSALVNLEHLILRNAQIESIEDGTFLNLNKLIELDLSFNQLSKLDSKSFVGLGGLKQLNLSANKLPSFDLSILEDNLTQIERVDLSQNSIRNKEEILNRFKDSKITFEF